MKSKHEVLPRYACIHCSHEVEGDSPSGLACGKCTDHSCIFEELEESSS